MKSSRATNRFRPMTLRLLQCLTYLVLFLTIQTVCAGALPGFPEKPTASITSIDKSGGVITAREGTTGRVFQFQLTNPTLLQSLSVGQALFVDFANKWVSLDGSRINGNITSIGPVDAAKPVGPVDGGKPVGPVDGFQSSARPDGTGGGNVTGARPAGPVDATRPIGPVDGAKPLGPIDGFQSSARPDGTGGGNVTGARPAGPVDGTRPIGPVDGAKPAGPVDGAKPFGPIDGVKPIGPVDAAKPVGPVDGVRPAGPVDGAHPAPFSDGGVATCTITGIDTSQGLITARENRTGRTFQFRPSNASFLRSLKPGQAVSADFASKRVSLMLNGANPTTIGSIVSDVRTATHK